MPFQLEVRTGVWRLVSSTAAIEASRPFLPTLLPSFFSFSLLAFLSLLTTVQSLLGAASAQTLVRFVVRVVGLRWPTRPTRAAPRPTRPRSRRRRVA
ncbi:unnamed protein product [Vitrella brassicaformis CCMP3155]|uniref:Uncharacterized protein n=1 Tax=Vitrella brassicaformis (strain CCMP3155) TaxID=1169540 RepID=A0A0G4FE79_VITBC|nr:unnamed protein product [Vitrella brassicaformis CCMP3155]|eukprot:CEM11510.1 unnamed protein product [Vitrella brassicaformis CCMP3155]